MRLNKYVANASGMSRRSADEAIAGGRVNVNGQVAIIGQRVSPEDSVTLDGRVLQPSALLYVAINKPPGYVCSRRGQNAPTIYELLPEKYHQLKSVGRLDKDSSGLILLTNDGDFSNLMTHPKFAKTKIYEVTTDKPLSLDHRKQVQSGVTLADGVSRLQVTDQTGKQLIINLSEGRNRQIRRTLAALGYSVIRLYRTQFGPYGLNGLQSGQYKEVEKL